MREIPPSIRKPSRYSGGEVRPPSIPWDEARVRVLLAFPDVYEIGMSHLGILLLREILSARPGTLCDRVFAPWTDYEEHLRAAGLPLASLESGRPAGTFDLLGFSLCYELTYTNVLAMLDLSGIPLLSKDRSEEHPLVVAGGVCTLNPAPVAPFFDALLAVPDEESVEEGGHGSGVQGAHAPGHDEGVLLRSVLRQEGDPGKVEHREDVRVGEFVAQGESEEVERPGGSTRFERRERQPGGAQMLLVVGPWGEDAIATGPGPRAEDLAQEQDPEVRHPDLVHVGKGEQHAHARFVPRDGGRTDLAAAVSRRLPDGGG